MELNIKHLLESDYKINDKHKGTFPDADDASEPVLEVE